jgi:hypothetical protein
MFERTPLNQLLTTIPARHEDDAEPQQLALL